MRSERELIQFTERRNLSPVIETGCRSDGDAGQTGITWIYFYYKRYRCVIEMEKMKREGFMDVFTNCRQAASKGSNLNLFSIETDVFIIFRDDRLIGKLYSSNFALWPLLHHMWNAHFYSKLSTLSFLLLLVLWTQCIYEIIYFRLQKNRFFYFYFICQSLQG